MYTNKSGKMNAIQMQKRMVRGAIIAQKCKIKKIGDMWRVPSQTRHLYYIVRFGGFADKPSCTCPDFESHQEKCKHIFAVEFSIKKEIDIDGNTTITKSIRVSYPQKWSAYDKSQTNEKKLFMELLRDLCNNIPEPEYTFGRPKLSIVDMVFASALKVYITFSLRRFTSDIKTAKEMGYVSKAPCFASVGHFMQKEELTPVLMKLIELSSLPLKSVETSFAVDSSGFSTSRFGRWHDYRFGKDQVKRLWIKAHLMIGVKTNIVVSLSLSSGYSNDGKYFPELVEKTAENFKIEEVSADKAYLSNKNLKLVDDLGGTAYIPFKKNTVALARNSRIWKKMYHYFLYKNEEFEEHYHKRSNIETTFYMIKTKFGSHIRSKKDTAQINEVLLKILCHNICVVIQEMNELGINPDNMLRQGFNDLKINKGV